MTYATMDHAGWVQRQIGPFKKQWASRKPRRDSSGRVIGWLAAPDHLTDFQSRVMDIIGIAGGGIYNAPVVWPSVDWNHGTGISFGWRGDLATFDSGRLTMFVFLCHDARIRFEVSPSGPGILRLSFWPRRSIGGIGRRHSNLAEAIATYRAYVPTDHSIAYMFGERDECEDAWGKAAEQFQGTQRGEERPGLPLAAE